MQSLRPVVSILGVIVMAFALTMFVPLGVALRMGEASAFAFHVGIGVTFLGGLLMWWVTRGGRRELQPRDGVLLVVLAWTLLPLFASLPLMIGLNRVGVPIGFTPAYFEAISGLTTTGATVLSGLNELPLSINVWRCFLQWMGGLGILVLAVAILPLLGVGGSQLFRAEVAGPLKDTKLTPRITETAKGLWSIYLVLSVLCLLAYRWGGMSWADAWMHMFTTVSLGGLSSHDASYGFFDSALIEAICVGFMLVCSCNFALYFMAVRKRSLKYFFRDPEARGTLGTLVLAALFVSGFLFVKGVYTDPLEALRYGVFNTVSIATTTGYSSTDFGVWPAFAPVLLLILSGVATSAGSTGCGIKMVRVIILFKQATREMSRLVHPRAVNPVTLGGGTVSSAMIFAVLAFMLVYGATILVLTMLLLMTDMDFITAFSAVVASVNNTGPGMGSVGPSSSFAHLTVFQQWVCMVGMLLGRLEMLTFLVILTPAFWRK